MNICIDIGNTQAKISLFKGDTMTEMLNFPVVDATVLNNIFINHPTIHQGILSSVRAGDHELMQFLKSTLKKFIVLDETTPIPIQNLYQTKQTLGKDRLAAVVGANYLYPQKNVLVVDAGSAITFDLINSNAEFLGGTISPGLTMRFKALNHFTSRLPLLDPAEGTPLIGRNTNEAIIAGVQNGLIFETDSYINELNRLYPGLITLITGGDAKFFDNKLKNAIFVVSNLVLIGLNRILNFNA